MPADLSVFIISCAAFLPALSSAFLSASLSSAPLALIWIGPIEATVSGNSPGTNILTSALTETKAEYPPFTVSGKAVLTFIVPVAKNLTLHCFRAASSIAVKIANSVSSLRLSDWENYCSTSLVGVVTQNFENIL